METVIWLQYRNNKRELLQKGYKEELQKLVSIYLTEEIRWWKLLIFPLCLKIKFLYMKQ